MYGLRCVRDKTAQIFATVALLSIFDGTNKEEDKLERLFDTSKICFLRYPSSKNTLERKRLTGTFA